MIHADFDGLHATIRANAHGGEPGKVVIAIGGPLGGSIVVDASDVPALQLELGNAHVHSLAMRADVERAAAPYAHA